MHQRLDVQVCVQVLEVSITHIKVSLKMVTSHTLCVKITFILKPTMPEYCDNTEIVE